MLPECKITLIPWWNTFWKNFRQWVHFLILQSESIWGSERCWEVPQARRASQVSGKEPTSQCRRHMRYRRCGFSPCVRKIPWRRKRQPTPVFLPGEFHGWGSREGYSPQGCKELDTTEATYRPSTHAQERNLRSQRLPCDFQKPLFNSYPLPSRGTKSFVEDILRNLTFEQFLIHV